jgi:predicted nuclease with TOPRIM domain
VASKRELEIENDELIDENESLRSSLADIKEQIEEIIGEPDESELSDSDSDD